MWQESKYGDLSIVGLMLPVIENENQSGSIKQQNVTIRPPKNPSIPSIHRMEQQRLAVIPILANNNWRRRRNYLVCLQKTVSVEDLSEREASLKWQKITGNFASLDSNVN